MLLIGEWSSEGMIESVFFVDFFSTFRYHTSVFDVIGLSLETSWAILLTDQQTHIKEGRAYFEE